MRFRLAGLMVILLAGAAQSGASFADGDVCGVQGAREPLSKQLTAAEARKYETKAYLAGSDGWDPTKAR